MIFRCDFVRYVSQWNAQWIFHHKNKNNDIDISCGFEDTNWRFAYWKNQVQFMQKFHAFSMPIAQRIITFTKLISFIVNKTYNWPMNDERIDRTFGVFVLFCFDHHYSSYFWKCLRKPNYRWQTQFQVDLIVNSWIVFDPNKVFKTRSSNRLFDGIAFVFIKHRFKWRKHLSHNVRCFHDFVLVFFDCFVCVIWLNTAYADLENGKKM